MIAVSRANQREKIVSVAKCSFHLLPAAFRRAVDVMIVLRSEVLRQTIHTSNQVADGIEKRTCPFGLFSRHGFRQSNLYACPIGHVHGQLVVSFSTMAVMLMATV